MHVRTLLCAQCFLLGVLLCSPVEAQTRPTSIQRVYELTDESVKWDHFEQTESGEEDLSLIELWEEAPPHALPTSRLFYGRPNYKIYLLENGLARLRTDVSAPQILIDAQERAKRNQAGMWAEPEDASAGAEEPPETEETESPDGDSPTEETDEATALEQKESILFGILRFLKTPEGLVALAGALATVLFGIRFHRWRNHHRLNLVFLGEPSTGKTWLYSRLVERNISVHRLKELQATKSRTRARTEELPMGPFRASPTFTDLPGSKPGQHLQEILAGRVRTAAKRAFFRRRSIWIIVLSTTQDSTATRDSEESVKIQPHFISRQLGYLRLPQAVLADPDLGKPALVVLCIAKVDLFLKHEPNDAESTTGVAALKRQFQEHIALIKGECSRQGIPFGDLYVSALKGWGVYDLEQLIRGALFVRSQ